MVLSRLHAVRGWHGREHLHLAGNHLDTRPLNTLSVGILPLREAALDRHFGVFMEVAFADVNAIIKEGNLSGRGAPAA